MAAADASFNISIEAISAGLTKINGLASGVWPNPATFAPGLADLPSNGTPSITYKGVFPERIELLPLIFTIVAAPGWPLVLIICKPATLPINN